jgi:2,4-dienoyl-CoA reductase-like NADH-dependent reductase (Old Yellow Enzyme family)
MKIPFENLRIGPLSIRNRFIRSAAFEGMAENHRVTEDLIEYHRSVAKGGVGMSTVAYASVSKNGLSFAHQLWLREEIIPDLKKLTSAIKQEGAAASIQIGHTGNMSKRSICGSRPIAPSGRFNLYGPTWPRKMNTKDIEQVIDDFRNAILIAKASGFDAVEVHAGHGYLISQFLSPYTNKRKDEYGGSFENRSRFLKKVLKAAREAAGNDMALLVKMNMTDGFKKGITEEEAVETAKVIESCGVDAIILSGGFVSKAPLYVMRGEIPPKIMSYHIKNIFVKVLVKFFGYQLMKPLPYKEGYFLDEAIKFRKAVKIAIVVVGGLNSTTTIHKALEMGFDGIGLARSLIQNTNFVNELHNQTIQRSGCTICNYCVAVMYSGKMRCFMDDTTAPKELIAEAKKIHYEPQ